MRTIATLICALLAGVSFAHAQIGNLLSPFEPTECLTAARQAVGLAGNPRLVALANAGVALPEEAGGINIGITTNDGKARLWYYVFISGPNDTVASIPMIRIVISCQDPSTLAGELPPADIGDLPLIPLPGTFVQGKALSNALAANTEFQRFRAVHPDSNPSFTVLTTSPEEGLGFPAMTPFWVLNWAELSGESPEPFVCLVHAVTGQTLCGEQITLSVNEEQNPHVFLSPNPVRDGATMALPTSWIGKSVVVEAFSATGEQTQVASISTLGSPIVPVNVSTLASGAYTLVARSGNSTVTLTMSVVR